MHTMKLISLIFISIFFLLSGIWISGENTIHQENDNELVSISESENTRHLMLIAGRASHSTGTHEHRAGVLIFERCLTGIEGLEVSTHFEGWPDDYSSFDRADAALFFMDGGGGHPIVQGNRLDFIQRQVDRGLSLGMIHYAVEVPADNGGKQFREWIGGHYETYHSANPIWEAHYEVLPSHPITRGVESFTARDEWYFNMRFRPNMVGVTPMLVAVPSDETRDGPYVHPRGPYDHIVEDKGRSEIMSWVVERGDGGRGLGFTGGHFHDNWGVDGFRTYILNALVWLAGVDVPMNGVQCAVTDDDLQQNLDR